MRSNKTVPVFSCNGETLSLEEIKEKKITSLTISYLSKEKDSPKATKTKSAKKGKQEEKEIVINDEKGITLFFYTWHPAISIFFSNIEDWEKIVDYDDETIFKKVSKRIFRPCQVNFPVSSLKSIKWE